MSAACRLVVRNFHDEATLTTEIPAADGFEIVNTQNCIRGDVWRSTGPADQSIFGTFADGFARTISSFSFFRHRCSGGNVRFEGFSDPAWTTRVIDSTVLPVIWYTATDGLDWGVNPYGTGSTDPFVTLAPFRAWLTPAACLSYKITFSDNVSTYGAAYWQVCRFFIGNHYATPRQPNFGLMLGRADLTDRDRSVGGSLRTNLSESWKTMSMEFNGITEDQRPAWIDIMEYALTGRDIVFSLYSEDFTRLGRDHFINCTMSGLDAINRQVRVLTKKLQIEEV